MIELNFMQILLEILIKYDEKEINKIIKKVLSFVMLM